MKTLKILKVFLGLKWGEFKEWFKTKGFEKVILVLVVIVFIAIWVTIGVCYDKDFL